MGGPEGPRRPSRVGSLSNGDSKRMPNKDWMEELSKMFPAEMAETRKKVRKEVERSIKAAKFLVAAQVCFVLAIVLVKQCIDHFTPAGFTAVRALVSLPFILALAKSDAKSWREFVGSWRELFSSGYLVFLGILVSLGQMLLVLGLERVSVGNTVVLGQLVPVYSATIAVFQGVESPSVGKFTAIAAGVIGAAVMLDPSQMWLSLGNMLLLGRAAVFAAYLALQAPVLRAYLPVTVAATCQIVGAVIAIAVGIPLALTGKGGAVGVMGGMRGTPGVAWIMAIAVAALSAAGYTLTARAERRTTPVVTACYNTLQPVIALTIMIALGESPGIRNLLGSALIMIGGFAAVALSTNDKKRWKQSYPPGDVGVDRNFKPEDAKLATGKTGGFGADGANVDDDGSSGTVRIKRTRGGERGFDPDTPTGTVRMTKLPGSLGAGARRPVKVGSVVWTVAWASVMSLCALAGGGYLTWFLVYLHWKYFLG